MSAFLALVESGQFKLAAERCHVSQSAFSQMISRLEAQLGVRLFDRDTRHVSLTPEGRLLEPVARGLAADVEAMYLHLRDHADRRTGKVALAALPSLCADWLPRILADFRNRYPGIAMEFHDTVSDASLEPVRRGTVDFAINARVSSPDEFDTRLLFNEPFYLICSPSHPLAQRKCVALRALAGCDYIQTIRSDSVWQWLDPHIRDIELKDAGFEVGHLSTLAGLIANGIGVSIVPGFTLFQFHRLGLSAIPISNPSLQRPLLVVKRRGHSLAVAAQALMELIVRSPPQHILQAGGKRKAAVRSAEALLR